MTLYAQKHVNCPTCTCTDPLPINSEPHAMNNTSPEAISELIERLQFAARNDFANSYLISEAMATLQHLSELVQAPLPEDVISMIEMLKEAEDYFGKPLELSQKAADMLERLARRQQYLEIPYFLRQPGAVEEDVIKEINKLKARIKELEEL